MNAFEKLRLLSLITKMIFNKKENTKQINFSSSQKNSIAVQILSFFRNAIMLFTPGIFIVMLFISSNTFGLQSYSVVLMWGSEGSKIAEFNYPHSIVVDPTGHVYVTDENNNRVQEFDSNGTFIRKWGSNGSSEGQFLKPEGIDLDSSGNVYVADTGNSRIQKFNTY